MVEATLFIALAIVGTTQFIKYVAPQINGAVTIGVAVLLGVLVGIFDTRIGVTDITVAAGIVIGLSAVGITTTASKVGAVLNTAKR